LSYSAARYRELISNRFPTPSTENLIGRVENTNLDLELASGDEKERLESLKETQTWAVLRKAVRNSYAKVRKITDANKLGRLIAKDEQGDREQSKSIAGDADDSIAESGGSNAVNAVGTTTTLE
jgi:hypothetical protein